MSSGNKKIIKQWFKYAARDLKAAFLIQKLGSEYKYTIAFHSQQTVEKVIKGMLIFYGQRPPKIHDIEKLAQLLSEFNPKLSSHALKLKLLTEFAVVYRYPDAESKSVSFAKIIRMTDQTKKFFDLALQLIDSNS